MLVVENCSEPVELSATDVKAILRRECPRYPRGAAKSTIAAPKPAPISIVAISRAISYALPCLALPSLFCSRVKWSAQVHQKEALAVGTLFIVRQYIRDSRWGVCFSLN